jgi:hypothetical protein
MAKKIVLILFILATVGIFVYFWKFYVKKETPIREIRIESELKNESSEAASQEDSSLSNHEAPADEESILDKDASIEMKPADIKTTDCDNECAAYSDPGQLKYCREICGLNENSSQSPENGNCESASGIQKDACLKNLAVKNKDLKLCGEISDAQIKKSCKNRVTEDLLEEQ